MSKIIKFSIKINKIMDINGRKIIIYIKIFLKSYNNNKIKKCFILKNINTINTINTINKINKINKIIKINKKFNKNRCN